MATYKAFYSCLSLFSSSYFSRAQSVTRPMNQVLHMLGAVATDESTTSLSPFSFNYCIHVYQYQYNIAKRYSQCKQCHLLQPSQSIYLQSHFHLHLFVIYSNSLSPIKDTSISVSSWLTQYYYMYLSLPLVQCHFRSPRCQLGFFRYVRNSI